MNNCKIVPCDWYNVFIRQIKDADYVIADVYQGGDRSGHRLLHQAYKSERIALAALKRRFKSGLLVLYREPWVGRIEKVGVEHFTIHHSIS
jgi:hypothetical protein